MVIGDMNRRTPLISNMAHTGFVAILLLGVVSCVSEGDEWQGSDIDDGKADGPSHHIEGQPTNGPDVFQWVDVDDTALTTYRNTIFPPPRRGSLLPVNHELTTRYQAFVDQMDAYVRRTSPELVQNTPRPQVRIYSDEMVNAWASGVPVCIDAPVTFDRATPVEGAREYFSVLLHHSYVEPLEEYSSGGGFFGEPPSRLVDCVDASYSSQVQELVDWMNARNGACRYELRDDRIHVSGQGCRIDLYQDDFAGAAAARYHAVIPYVFITTAFLEFIEDEAQTVSVIAHELAHYYKSHATNADFELTGDIFEGASLEDFESDGTGYNYFYSQQLEPRPTKPPPRSDSNDIRQRVLRFSPNQDNPFKGVDGATLDPTLGRFLVSVVYGGEFPRDISPSCGRAYDIVMDNSFFNLVYEKELGEVGEAAYPGLEAAFHECAGTIQVPGDLELDRVRSSFSRPMQIHIRDFAMEGSLRDIVQELDSRMRGYSADERAFYDFMTRERIGYYTAEQEADEMGAELMAAIGLDPRSHALLDLRGGERREAEAPTAFERINGLTMARCRELFDNDWVEPETGEYVFVPIGSLSDIHHGACHRAFNTTREILAHGYGGEPVPVEGGLDMDESGAVLSGQEMRYQTAALEPGAYTFELTGTGDADLYVRVGEPPTVDTYDCRPYRSDSDELCTVELETDAVVHVMVRGYAASSEYHLMAR